MTEQGRPSPQPSPQWGEGDRHVLLEARGITRRFPGVVANDDVSFELRAGEIHAVVGENGAGKTTLMNICYGLEHPDEGTILMGGAPVVLRSPADALRRGIAMVHQHFMLVPVFTVAENVMLGAESTRSGGRLDRAAVRTRLRDLGMQYDMAVDPDAAVETLSVGQQQRVEILKALYRQARILILDEPTAVLTPQECEGLFDVLRRLASEGIGIVLITHKLHEALAVANRITVMRRGKVVATLQPAETSAAKLATLMVGRPVEIELAKPPPRAGEVLLRVSDLSVRDARGVLAVDGVSFEVRAGEILGIAGVQGNGQTELVGALVGLRPIESGSVSWPGVAETQPGPRAVRAGGTVHIPEDRQRDGLVLRFPVADNVVLCAYDEPPFATSLQRNEQAIAAHAQHLIAEYDVRPPNVRAPVGQLSGGNQQKVILARELSGDVRLVIANQPTRGLDVGSVEEVHRRLLALREAGCAILLVSTELDELRALADRIGVLYRGRLVATVDPAQTTPEQLGLLMSGAV